MCVGASVYTCVGVCVYRCVCEFTLTKKRARPVKCATAAARRQLARPTWSTQTGHMWSASGRKHGGMGVATLWAAAACPLGDQSVSQCESFD